MTPHSTERSPKMSPLDIFGAMAHSATPGGEPSPAFKAVLNKATPLAKAEQHRQPVQKGAAEHSRQDKQDKDVRKEHAPDRASAPSGKKPPAKPGPINRPQRKDDDREPSDEPAAEQVGARQPTDSAPSSPQTQDAPDGQEVVGNDETQPVDPASEQAPGGNADAALPLVALAEQLTDVVMQPSASAEPSETQVPELNAATLPITENSVAVNKPTLPLDEPQTSGDAAPSPQEYADAALGNGRLSLAEPGQDSVHAADPIAAIDQQTAAAAVEIQPVEPSGNHKHDKRDDSSASDGPQQNAGDASQQIAANPVTLTTQETQSAAALPPSTPDSAPSLPKEAPPPQNGNAQQTAGVQPSPNRLPQHVLTRAEGHRIHNPAPVPVDTARFISRVAKAFLSAQQRDGNEVRLRLSPPELGSLRLQVSVQDGVMVARMETETEAARSSLVNNLPALRERLAEQGIRVERFDIDLMQRPSTGTPDRPSDPQQQNEPQTFRPLQARPAISDAPAPTTLSNNWNGQGRLNVII